MDDITKLIYKETKDNHRLVDNHKFTRSIKHDNKAGNKYIVFNKLCIYTLQKALTDSGNTIIDVDLQLKLHRDTGCTIIHYDNTVNKEYDISTLFNEYKNGRNILIKSIKDKYGYTQKLYTVDGITNIKISKNMTELLDRCEKYPLEHSYMFYLGLLSGGSILKKYIDSDHHEFLNFCDPKDLSREFKNFITKSIHQHYNIDYFISIVNESYKLIESCFDELV